MPILDIFWSMLVFFIWMAWIVLVVRVVADILQSSISGWSKALWSLFVIALPFLGVFCYLIVHGDGMAAREDGDYMDAVADQQDYIRSVTGTSVADELTKLAKLRDDGTITESEFNAQKAHLLST